MSVLLPLATTTTQLVSDVGVATEQRDRGQAPTTLSGRRPETRRTNVSLNGTNEASYDVTSSA
jgi:hypothetical protein